MLACTLLLTADVLFVTAEGKGSSRVLSITLCKAPPLGSEERFSMWASLLLGQDDSRELQDQQRAS
jgi:hypothetical protein